jgi:hypothetical protein
MLCRVQTRIPIPIEKFDNLEMLGRFTVRDEGKTIAVGKILKYKPMKVQVLPTMTHTLTEETKSDAPAKISSSATKKPAVDKDLVFDMDSGQMLTREEFNKRQQEKDDLEGIDEDDYDDEDEEDIKGK